MSSECFDGDDALTRYDRWRRSRWEEVAGPDGKASLIAYRTITEPGQEVPEVPGRWTSTGPSGSLTLTATREQGVSVDGQTVDGTVELMTGAVGLSFPGGRRGTIEELAGAHALAVWDPAAPTLVGLRGIDAWPWDPSWTVEAEYRPADAGRILELTRTTSPVIRDTIPAAGDLVFDLRGERHTLRAFDMGSDVLLITFTDDTSGTDTPSMGRWLVLSRPQHTTDTVRIDFNRALIPHHMFSAAFPCPLPLQENHLPLRIEAGERAPVFEEEAAVSTTTGPAV
ncbi:hypothetical protein SSPO_004800 [Streptomyces antimycoticus]|uniref:DUF1684 domain-containing protein n=1 Tax=Streptomyces antimycoticus TaxID=68175 RepID=A0A499UCF7_9ACTN|nr:hypothetical protein SSPO_004800 [Streptomyces antimycoticus]